MVPAAADPDGTRTPAPDGLILGPVPLTAAPPVTRTTGRPYRRPRAPAWVLVFLGAALVVGPVLGGMFSKSAAGRQMIDRFAPHMTPAALHGYQADLAVLRRAGTAVQDVYAHQPIPAGAYPGLEVLRRQTQSINSRDQRLLDRIVATEPDYRRVAAIGGFDRIPFLLTTAGLVFLYGGGVLLAGRRRRGRGAAALVALVAAALVAYPFLSGLNRGDVAGEHLLRSFTPVMTAGEVRQLQSDFVVLVTAVGELDTGFRHVARPGPAADAIAAVDQQWPRISSDLAALVGVINDDLGNFTSLRQLDALPRHLGLPGFEAFTWMLVAVGCLGLGGAAAAWPRPQRKTT